MPSHREIAYRDARPRDRAGVLELCRAIDPADFMVDAWDVWTRRADDLQIVAVAGGERVVGALYAGFVGPSAVFSQGLRVDAGYRRRGVARGLLAFQAERLAGICVSTAFGVTGLDNRPARELFAANGWREVAAVARRARHGWRGSSTRHAVGARDAFAVETVGRDLLLSRPGLAHFRRIFRGRACEQLKELVRDQRLLSFGPVRALVDPPAEGTEWLGTLAGDPAALAEFLDACSLPRHAEERQWIVDAPDDAGLQSHLDRLGFAPPGPNDRYVVLESEIGPTALKVAKSLSK